MHTLKCCTELKPKKITCCSSGLGFFAEVSGKKSGGARWGWWLLSWLSTCHFYPPQIHPVSFREVCEDFSFMWMNSVIPPLRSKTSCSHYRGSLQMIRGNSSVSKSVTAQQKHSCLPKETNRLNLVGRKQHWVVMFTGKDNQALSAKFILRCRL